MTPEEIVKLPPEQQVQAIKLYGVTVLESWANSMEEANKDEKSPPKIILIQVIINSLRQMARKEREYHEPVSP